MIVHISNDGSQCPENPFLSRKIRAMAEHPRLADDPIMLSGRYQRRFPAFPFPAQGGRGSAPGKGDYARVGKVRDTASVNVFAVFDGEDQECNSGSGRARHRKTTERVTCLVTNPDQHLQLFSSHHALKRTITGRKGTRGRSLALHVCEAVVEIAAVKIPANDLLNKNGKIHIVVQIVPRRYG
jgi:hypothetical protein